MLFLELERLMKTEEEYNLLWEQITNEEIKRKQEEDEVKIKKIKQKQQAIKQIVIPDENIVKMFLIICNRNKLKLNNLSYNDPIKKVKFAIFDWLEFM